MMRSTVGRLALGVALFLALAVVSAAQAQNATAALTRDQLTVLLSVGVSDAEVARLLQARGLDFRPTQEDMARFKQLQVGPLTGAALAKAATPAAPQMDAKTNLLRAFFSVGRRLRISTLTPRALVTEEAKYDAESLERSRQNQSVLQTELLTIGAPADIQKMAKSLTALLKQRTITPQEVVDRAATLESSCDEWVATVTAERKYNYDLGAWLMEVSLGLIEQEQDLDSVQTYLTGAQKMGVTGEAIDLLTRMQVSLKAMPAEGESPAEAQAREDADRLIAIGVVVPGSGQAAPKPSGGSDNNRIQPVEF